MSPVRINIPVDEEKGLKEKIKAETANRSGYALIFSQILSFQGCIRFSDLIKMC